MSRKSKGGSGSGHVLEYARGAVIPGTSFRVRGILGRGAFGTVYDCDHLKLGVNAAVKLLNAELAHRPDLEALMLAEARRTAQIENDHVVKVRSIGVTKEPKPRLYVEMFKLSGESLFAVLRAAGRLEVLEAILYGLHIATGLAGAHAIGLIHCDVKPANIFLARIYDPMRREWVTRAVVLDLGVAQISSRASSERGSFVGSPITAAPEQIDGRFYVQSDVYALGVTMFMMLTGTHPHGPFSSPRDLMCAKIVPARIKRLHNVLPAVAEGAFVDDLLDDLLWRMMQPEYTDRPPTMEHVIAELSLIQERQEQRDLEAALLAKGKVKPRGRGAATTPEPPEAMRARMRDHYTTQNEDVPTSPLEEAPPSIDELLEGMKNKRADESRAEAQRRQIERFSAGLTNNVALPEDRRPKDKSAHAEAENARRQRARVQADEMGFFDTEASTGSSRLELAGIEETAPMPGAPKLPVAKKRASAANEPAATGHARSAGNVAAAQADSELVVGNTSADREFFLGGKSTQRSVADAAFDRASPAPRAPEERVRLSDLPRPDRRYNQERRPSTFGAVIDDEPERVPLQSWLRRRMRKSPLFSGVVAGVVALVVFGVPMMVVLRACVFDATPPPPASRAASPEPTATAVTGPTEPALPSLPSLPVQATVEAPPGRSPTSPAPIVTAASDRRLSPSQVPLASASALPLKPANPVATTSPLIPPAPGPIQPAPGPAVPSTPHGALIQ